VLQSEALWFWYEYPAAKLDPPMILCMCMERVLGSTMGLKSSGIRSIISLHPCVASQKGGINSLYTSYKEFLDDVKVPSIRLSEDRGGGDRCSKSVFDKCRAKHDDSLP
jgi:hypothetical protein